MTDAYNTYGVETTTNKELMEKINHCIFTARSLSEKLKVNNDRVSEDFRGLNGALAAAGRVSSKYCKLATWFKEEVK